MAPERFGDEPCAPATATYSLACVLYEALTADTPFPTGHPALSDLQIHAAWKPRRAGRQPVPVAMTAEQIEDTVTRGRR